ncbi:MAG: aminotransferase class V-fold PLP-dependent enzyme [Pseudomonadota bacterium]
MSATQSMVADEVYTALAKPAVTQFDPLFSDLLHDISQRLRIVFGTQDHETMALYGIGTQSIEQCLYNILEPQESILVLVNGIHGQHICDLATRLGYDVDTVSVPWGQPILPENVQPLLERKRYALVAVAHAESSTGVTSPMTGLGHLVRGAGALFMVDCVASLGGIPVSLDAWHADVALSVPHRCLSCPSGLGIVSLSQNAVKHLEKRHPHLHGSQQSLLSLLHQWRNPQSSILMTPPVNLLYALNAALNSLLNEELHNVFLRHRSVQKQMVEGMTDLGLQCYVGSAWRLPMVTVFQLPDSLPLSTVRTALLHDHSIDIRDSLGVKGQYLRVGHMGHTARSSNVARFCDAMKSIVG